MEGINHLVNGSSKETVLQTLSNCIVSPAILHAAAEAHVVLERVSVSDPQCRAPSAPGRSLVPRSLRTMGRVMASPGPPHSAWLRCQHQASHAIKQLAPFINHTSTINVRGGATWGKVEGFGEGRGERRRRGARWCLCWTVCSGSVCCAGTDSALNKSCDVFQWLKKRKGLTLHSSWNITPVSFKKKLPIFKNKTTVASPWLQKCQTCHGDEIKQPYWWMWKPQLPLSPCIRTGAAADWNASHIHLHICLLLTTLFII